METLDQFWIRAESLVEVKLNIHLGLFKEWVKNLSKILHVLCVLFHLF